MRIYVDADGFPTAAKDLLIRAAVRLHVPVVFVANKRVSYEPSVIISSIIVPEGPDLADDRIAELAQPGDLVITADIPLADRVVAKGAFAPRSFDRMPARTSSTSRSPDGACR